MLFVRSLLQTLAEKYVFRVVKPVKNLENAKKSPIFTTNLTLFLFKPKTRNLLPNLFFLYVKSSFSEKATKIWKNLPPVLTKQLFLLSSVKTRGIFFQIFVAFSEKLDFTHLKKLSKNL